MRLRARGLSTLSGLLKGAAERARPVFKKLNLQVRLFPVTKEESFERSRDCQSQSQRRTTNSAQLSGGSRAELASEFRLGFAAEPAEGAVARAGKPTSLKPLDR